MARGEVKAISKNRKMTPENLCGLLLGGAVLPAIMICGLHFTRLGDTEPNVYLKYQEQMWVGHGLDLTRTQITTYCPPA